MRFRAMRSMASCRLLHHRRQNWLLQGESEPVESGQQRLRVSVGVWSARELAEVGVRLDAEQRWQPVAARQKGARPGEAVVWLREKRWLTEPFGGAVER